MGVYKGIEYSEADTTQGKRYYWQQQTYYDIQSLRLAIDQWLYRKAFEDAKQQ